MIISIEKKTFSDAVHIVARFADRKRASLPALSAILIIAGDEGIKMRATNLETGIDHKIEGTCSISPILAVLILAILKTPFKFEQLLTYYYIYF